MATYLGSRSLACARAFLEDAEADISSAGALIGDDAEKNRVALRLLIEGAEKALKALWLVFREHFERLKTMYPDLGGRCPEVADCLSRLLEVDPKSLGHEVSLGVLKAFADAAYYLAGCEGGCRPLEELLQGLAGPAEGRRIQALLQGLPRETYCERLRDLRDRISRSRKKGKEKACGGPVKRPSRWASLCEDKEIRGLIDEAVAEAARLLDDMEGEKARLAAGTANLRESLTEAAGLLLIYSSYLPLLLIELHLATYPCYWPSRYRCEGPVPSEVLDRNLLEAVHDVARKAVNYMDEFLRLSETMLGAG